MLCRPLAWERAWAQGKEELLSVSLPAASIVEILCVYLNKLLLIAVASFQLLGDSRAWKLRVFLVHL